MPDIITALVTPFDDHNHIDDAVLERLTEHLIEAGSTGFVIGGTTGEGPTLTTEEKLALYRRFAAIVHGRAQVIANVGSNATQASIDFAKQVNAIAEVDAILAVVPYYNKPNQAGMVAHFTALAEASVHPVILYNIPGRTGVTMDVATVCQLATVPNIIGVKQCGDLEDFAAIVAGTPDDFKVWTGEDAQFATSVSLGGAGVISVAAHLFTKPMQAAYQAQAGGDLATLAKLQQQLLPKMAALFAWPSPAPAKAALIAQGFAVGAPRLPLLPLTPDQQGQLMEVLNR